MSKYIHVQSGVPVAIKTFVLENEENGLNYSTMRELSVLKKLKNKKNFV